MAKKTQKKNKTKYKKKKATVADKAAAASEQKNSKEVKKKPATTTRKSSSTEKKLQGNYKEIIATIDTRVKILQKSKFGFLLNRSLLVILLIILSAGFVYLFSADTRGSFSHQDLYAISFDHYPSLSEIESLLDEYENINPEQVRVEDGNILTFRSSREIFSDPRDEFVQAVSTREDVISAEAYRVYPVSPVDRFGLQTVLSTVALLTGAALVLGYFYRKQAEKGLKIYSSLFVFPAALILLLAVIGITISKIGILDYTKMTFSWFIALSSVIIVSTVYMLNNQLRQNIFNILFTDKST
jgi:hypothetical protein